MSPSARAMGDATTHLCLPDTKLDSHRPHSDTHQRATRTQAEREPTPDTRHPTPDTRHPTQSETCPHLALRREPAVHVEHRLRLLVRRRVTGLGVGACVAGARSLVVGRPIWARQHGRDLLPQPAFVRAREVA
eukprot:1489534-Rhodomonas_salina.2